MIDFASVAKIEKLTRLIDEAYDHYFRYGDGYSKSSEGYINIRLDNYFDRRDGNNQIGVEIYSSIFGCGRHHHFDSIEEALSEVICWHQEEMANKHTGGVAGWGWAASE